MALLSLLLSSLLLLVFKSDTIDIVPPGVNLIAFARRLDITCEILILSAFRRISFGW
jgi:hypothetical protein